MKKKYVIILAVVCIAIVAVILAWLLLKTNSEKSNTFYVPLNEDVSLVLNEEDFIVTLTKINYWNTDRVHLTMEITVENTTDTGTYISLGDGAVKVNGYSYEATRLLYVEEGETESTTWKIDSERIAKY